MSAQSDGTLVPMEGAASTPSWVFSRMPKVIDYSPDHVVLAWAGDFADLKDNAEVSFDVIVEECSWNGEAASGKLRHRVERNDKGEYRVDGLKPGTDYSFTVLPIVQLTATEQVLNKSPATSPEVLPAKESAEKPPELPTLEAEPVPAAASSGLAAETDQAVVVQVVEDPAPVADAPPPRQAAEQAAARDGRPADALPAPVASSHADAGPAPVASSEPREVPGNALPQVQDFHVKLCRTTEIHLEWVAPEEELGCFYVSVFLRSESANGTDAARYELVRIEMVLWSRAFARHSYAVGGLTPATSYSFEVVSSRCDRTSTPCRADATTCASPQSGLPVERCTNTADVGEVIDIIADRSGDQRVDPPHISRPSCAGSAQPILGALLICLHVSNIVLELDSEFETLCVVAVALPVFMNFIVTLAYVLLHNDREHTAFGIWRGQNKAKALVFTFLSFANTEALKLFGRSRLEDTLEEEVERWQTAVLAASDARVDEAIRLAKARAAAEAAALSEGSAQSPHKVLDWIESGETPRQSKDSPSIATEIVESTLRPGQLKVGEPSPTSALLPSPPTQAPPPLVGSGELVKAPLRPMPPPLPAAWAEPLPPSSQMSLPCFVPLPPPERPGRRSSGRLAESASRPASDVDDREAASAAPAALKLASEPRHGAAPACIACDGEGCGLCANRAQPAEEASPPPDEPSGGEESPAEEPPAHQRDRFDGCLLFGAEKRRRFTEAILLDEKHCRLAIASAALYRDLPQVALTVILQMEAGTYGFEMALRMANVAFTLLWVLSQVVALLSWLGKSSQERPVSLMMFQRGRFQKSPIKKQASDVQSEAGPSWVSVSWVPATTRSSARAAAEHWCELRAISGVGKEESPVGAKRQVIVAPDGSTRLHTGRVHCRFSGLRPGTFYEARVLTAVGGEVVGTTLTALAFTTAAANPESLKTLRQAAAATKGPTALDHGAHAQAWPSKLKAVQVSDKSVVLEWTAASGDHRVRLHRYAGGPVPSNGRLEATLLREEVARGCSLEVWGLSPDTDYLVEVEPLIAGKQRPPKEACRLVFRTMSQSFPSPLVPMHTCQSGLDCSQATSSSVQLQWKAATFGSTQVDRYFVECSIGSPMELGQKWTASAYAVVGGAPSVLCGRRPIDCSQPLAVRDSPQRDASKSSDAVLAIAVDVPSSKQEDHGSSSTEVLSPKQAKDMLNLSLDVPLPEPSVADEASDAETEGAQNDVEFKASQEAVDFCAEAAVLAFEATLTTSQGACDAQIMGLDAPA